MGNDRPTTSSLGRFLRLSGLMGRVGASVLSERALDFAMAGPAKQIRRTENLVKNALRIVDTLGEMKGGAMKIGQMLSLHEGMMPPEVSEVLTSLQKAAPPVPSEVMRYEIEGSLGATVGDLFLEFDEDAFAAASIGQVHRARTKDRRRVAVKIQYPLIDEIVKADLKNLKTLLRSLFSLFSETEFEPIWRELRDRLFEELDYEHEAANMNQMAALHAGIPEIVIPQVIDELSTERVLTMEYLGGISPEDACSSRYPQALKDSWGQVLFEFQMRGLFEHRLLHADPNLANFAFLEDGRVIVYDFGCLKRIPTEISDGYAALARAIMDERKVDIPDLLLDMGVYRRGPIPIEAEVIDPYIDLFGEIIRTDPPYRFGDDETVYERILELGAANWNKAVDVRFPEDIVFLDRSLAGHFGNLIRLGATGPWRELVSTYVNSSPPN